ncbi:MAG: hypothetical protein IKE04_05675 [Oscillospiraceae bacterium]|nr:hypothetical protein [Oscillospiraceae bacterium]
MNRFMRSLSGKSRRLLQILDSMVPSDVEANDGGPGSGNWGHKGRPGKVGGSGKGGGKQYRGGREDTLFTSSKRDWLNGLQGERQHEAQQWMRRMRIHYSQPGEKEKSVEQCIMEEPRTGYGGNQQRQQLLSFMAEARGWNENAKRLVRENWDENDRKLAQALADKYGVAFTGGTSLPDDSSMTDQWEPEDLRTWQDLKSKAMGGPTSGQEAPDELQYEAGLKERPEPEAPSIPKTPQENSDWFDSLPAEHQRDIRELLKSAGISPDGFAGTDLEQAERKLLNGVYANDPNMITAAGLYFRRKDQLLGERFFKSVQGAENGGAPIGNLNDRAFAEVSALLMDRLDALRKKPGYADATMESMGEFIESEFLRDSSVPASAKRAYLALKAAALGYDVNSYGQSTHVRTLSDYRQLQRQRNEARRTREEKQREWQEHASNPEYIESMYHPAAVAGVNRRPEGNMSFEEADHRRANPHYAEDRNYRINCQTCVVAHEMRLRGYDVEAKPRHGDAENMQVRVASSRGGNVAWMDPATGEMVKSTTALSAGATTRKRVLSWLDGTVKPGERYHLAFCWRDRSAAHIVTLQRDESDGALMIYDPQSGRIIRDLDFYLRDCNYTAQSSGRWPMQLTRVDNALPVADVVDRILKPAG